MTTQKWEDRETSATLTNYEWATLCAAAFAVFTEEPLHPRSKILREIRRKLMQQVFHQ